MSYVLVLLAIGLAFAAWKATDRPTRLLLSAMCVLNLACTVHMVATGYEYAYSLRQSAPDSWQEHARP